MTTDPSQIQLTLDQCRLLAEAADQTGKPWAELLESALKHFVLNSPALNGKRSLYDAFRDSNALGSVDGPTDLSTDPKHMEGFGRSGS
jgi:hypothetical protein